MKVCQYCKNKNTLQEESQYDDESYSGTFQICSCWRKKPLFIIEQETDSIVRKWWLSKWYKYWV